jgi:hypothetical protein
MSISFRNVFRVVAIFHVLVQFFSPVWMPYVVVESIDLRQDLPFESLGFGFRHFLQFLERWIAQCHGYFLSSASRIFIVLSRARNVDSLILWDVAQSLIDIRMPLCSTPQFPQDDV